MPEEAQRVSPGVSKTAKALIAEGKVHEGLAAILAGSKDGGSEDVTKAYEAALQGLVDDRYKALGLETGCEPKDVKKAYRKLVLKYHPDKNPHTTPVFQAVQEAYEVLSDPSKRREHDRERNRPKPKPPPPKPHAKSGYNKPQPPKPGYRPPPPKHNQQAPPKPTYTPKPTSMPT